MPKTVIFANGTPNNLSENRCHISPGDTIICADGGTLHALTLGLNPHIIIGDLDSLPADVQAEMEARGVEIQRHPVKKDQTDLELALSVAVERGAKEVLILTALGGRLDQHLANILLLTRPDWKSVRLRLAEGKEVGWLMRGPDQLKLNGQPGDILSILVLTQTVSGLDLVGVEWPLQQATVDLGSTLTISNTFIKPEVTVRLKTGIALVVQSPPLP